MSKRENGSVLILVLIALLSVIFIFLVLKPQQLNQDRNKPTPTPTNSSKYLDAEGLVSMTICEKKYLSWNLATIAKALDIKIPPYMVQNIDWDGQFFDIKHPDLGTFGLSTSLVGDYIPQGVIGFDNILQSVLLTKNNDFDSPKYYIDKNSNKFVFGKTHALVVKQADPSRWWMFDINGNSIIEQEQLLKTDDLKCMVRSVTFK